MGVIAAAWPESTDRELVEAVRAGDETAFEELYRRYSRRVAGYVLRMVGDHDRAEDVTQEAFVSALRRLRATDSEVAFKPWIFEIAKNAAIDHYRRTSRAEEVSIDPDDGGLRAGDQLRLIGGGPPPERALLDKERLDHLRGAFDELSETHLRILVMREFEGLSYREIGERMALTRPAVESTLFRARRRLTHEYAEIHDGARCVAMLAALVRLADGRESVRDERRVGRHLRRCTPCRREARELGLDVERRFGVGIRVAALLPLPALLRRRRGGPSEAAGAAQGHAAGTLPAFASAGGEVALAGWGKAAAVVATLALAGGGAAVDHRAAPAERGPSQATAAEAPKRGIERERTRALRRPAARRATRPAGGSPRPAADSAPGDAPAAAREGAGGLAERLVPGAPVPPAPPLDGVPGGSLAGGDDPPSIDPPPPPSGTPDLDRPSPVPDLPVAPPVAVPPVGVPGAPGSH